ncbi:aguA [Symbiodinium sp. CCMP2456]|nr:aguA [Symbiodinium sp. CCMP2456]
MHRKGLNIDINHFHSEMNACKNAEPPSPSTAMYLYKQLLEKGFEPTASTMSILVGAHNHAPLSKILSVRSLCCLMPVCSRTLILGTVTWLLCWKEDAFQEMRRI